MSVEAPISRVSLTWLLVAQTLVMIPFWLHVPVWMVGLWLGCSLWRVQVYRMRANYPGRWVKLLLLLATALGVWWSRGSLVGLDAGAVLLIAAFALKLLELRTRRDGLVLIFLGFFCIVVAYLFDDSLLWALYSLLPISALLAALIGLQQSALTRPAATLRLATSLLLQAVPLMLLMFLFFPRIAPLWSLPLPSGQGVSGLSQSMAPGDVAELSRSSELAFRARFEGEVPPRQALYWRALSLSSFDGQRWTQSPEPRSTPSPQWQPTGEPWQYSIILQPSGKPWLPALDVARTDLPGVRQLGDYRLQRQRPVQQALLYSVSSWPLVPRDLQLSDRARLQALQLPARGDPQTRRWADELRQHYPKPQALVEALLAYFHEQPFHYTLKPPTLGRHSIDSFLFDSRRGFCAHYAGAMTYVLRAAGIPARMVVGYQGGEWNPGGNFLTVRQFDAHAWVEYWQAGQGWRSVDPTYAVAPQRIEQGLEQALAADEAFLDGSPMSPLRFRNLTWLNDVRLEWDNLNYGWQRWVLGYQGEQQWQVLGQWFGEFSRLIVVLGVLLVLGGVSLFVLRPWQRRTDPSLQVFKDFERLLKRRGLQRDPGEGPQAFAERAARQLPAQAASIRLFAGAFVARHYGGGAQTPAVLRHALRQLRRKL